MGEYQRGAGPGAVAVADDEAWRRPTLELNIVAALRQMFVGWNALVAEQLQERVLRGNLVSAGEIGQRVATEQHLGPIAVQLHVCQAVYARFDQPGFGAVRYADQLVAVEQQQAEAAIPAGNDGSGVVPGRAIRVEEPGGELTA